MLSPVVAYGRMGNSVLWSFLEMSEGQCLLFLLDALQFSDSVFSSIYSFPLSSKGPLQECPLRWPKHDK